MDDEPKTAAEMKEIRLNRKLAQDAEGIKAMADIAAADLVMTGGMLPQENDPGQRPGSGSGRGGRP